MIKKIEKRYTWINNIVGKEHLNENVGPETTEWSQTEQKERNVSDS